MHDQNPLRMLETPANDVDLRDVLRLGPSDHLRTLASAEVAWRFVEGLTGAVPQTVTFWTNNLDFTPPMALLGDAEGWNIYNWTVVADLADAASQLALMSIGGMFAALEGEMVARRLVSTAVLARAALEHAVTLDNLTTVLVERGVADWIGDDGKRIREAEELRST